MAALTLFALMIAVDVSSSSDSCSNVTVAPNTGLAITPGVNGVDYHNPAGTLQGCCDACAAAGPTKCEAFFTGPKYELCVLYPRGSVVGTRYHANHTSGCRGTCLPTPPNPRFPGGSLDQTLVVLTQPEADEYGAKCLDGSPPAIYYSPARGDENKDNWVLYFKGGGWCFNEQDCARRSKSTLGTTTILPHFLNQTWDISSGPLHPSSKLNPTFSNYHRVLLWYCDGASFAGSVENPVVNSTNGKNVSMYFRGRAVLDSLIGKLKKDYGMGTAKQVLLTGCSAGGMSTYLHADYVKTQVMNPALTRYKVAALSGFFLDHKTVSGVPLAREQYEYMFKMQNMTSGVNQGCVQANSDPFTDCATPQQNYKYTQSPFLVMNSMLDAYQMGNILNVGCTSPEHCNATQISEMIQYQKDFYNTLVGFETFHKSGNGAFVQNCVLHCGEQNANGFNQIAVAKGNGDGNGGHKQDEKTVMQQALTLWWESDSSEPAAAHTYVESCMLTGSTPCNPTCPSGTLSQ